MSSLQGKFDSLYIEQLCTGTWNVEDDVFFKEVAGLRVSAYCCYPIRCDSEIVWHIPFNRRSWHADMSCYIGWGKGWEKCNDFSMG
ncbi:hypothetical protein EAE89_11880 [Photorhabdus heterorhabditis]|nr:hypothetical protein [Photorhabdus heterorhabditis]